MSIDIEPAIPDVAGTNSGLQTKGAEVKLTNVLGVMYDVDACMVDYQLEDALSSPVEARKRFYNIWWSFAKNSIVDYTEQGVLLYMADPTNKTTKAAYMAKFALATKAASKN